MDVVVRNAVADEWRAVREIRLRALAEEPRAFGSTYAREAPFDESEWRHRITPAATLLVDGILTWAKDSNARLVTPLSLNRR